MVAAILVAAAASCSAPEVGASSNTACDSPGVTPEQVTLGFVYSASGGAGATFSSARSGLDARIGLANEEGGIHGRKIVYQWRDDESAAPVNTTVTEDLVQRESVFGLVTTSAAMADSMGYLTGQGVPVTGLAIEPAWAEHENMFTFMYSTSPDVIGRYIQAAGGTKVALVTSAPSAFTSESAATYSQALQALGVTIAAVVPYTAGSDSPDRVARQIADSGADALLGIGTPDEFSDIVAATHNAGYDVATSVTLSGYDRSLLAESGPALVGVSIPVFFRPFEAGGAATENYRDAMTRYAPETIDPEQQFAMFSYIHTDLFLRGLDLAGPCPTREGMINALRALPDYDAGGLIAPTDLRDNVGEPIKCHAFVQVDPAGTAFNVAQERICADGTTG